MSTNKDVSRFFRHSAIYALGSAMNRVGAFLLLPLYTHYLTVAQFGTLELFYAISAIVSGVLSVGIAHATLRFYFDYVDPDDRKAVVSTNLIASFCLSVAGVLIVSLFGTTLVSVVLGNSGPEWALQIVLITLVLELSSQVALAYLRALEMSVFFICVSFGKLIIQCIANGILLVKFDAGVSGILLGNMLAVLLGWIIVAGFTIKRCGLRFHTKKLIPILKYSLPFLYITIIATISANFDRFLLNKAQSIEAVGIFSLAVKFSKLISDLIGEPFNRAYGAFRFTIMKQPDAPMIQANILRYVSIALAAISLAIVYFTKDVLLLMSSHEFVQAASLMPMLVVAASMQIISYILQTGILYQKKTGGLVNIMLIRTGIFIVIAIPLIFFYGMQGACFAALSDGIITVILTHRMSQRYFYVQYDHKRLIALTFLSLLFYALAIPLDFLSPLEEFSAKVALWSAFLGAALGGGVLTKTEQQWLTKKIRSSVFS